MSGKTNKSITKRFKITKNRHLMHRLPHQDHFLAKESGNKKRKKKKAKGVKGTLRRELIKLSRSS